MNEWVVIPSNPVVLSWAEQNEVEKFNIMGDSAVQFMKTAHGELSLEATQDKTQNFSDFAYILVVEFLAIFSVFV